MDVDRTSYREVCFDADEGYRRTPIVQRSDLVAGAQPGPVIIEFGSTSSVHPGFDVRVDDFGNLVIARDRPMSTTTVERPMSARPVNPGLPTAYEHGGRLTAEGTAVDPILVEIVQGTLASVRWRSRRRPGAPAEAR